MAIIQPVIMAGGRGTRLWPLSHAGKPKQFLPLVTEQALIADAAARIPARMGARPPIIITGEPYAFAARAALQDAKIAFSQIVLESVGRSTAPAAAVAALLAGPDTIVVLLAADHAIPDAQAFGRALEQAVAAAEKDAIAVLGVTPANASTRFGYIRLGDKTGDGVYRVAKFVEKPDAATAAKFVAEKNYLWNSGNFVFRADRITEELQKHAPDVLASARAAVVGAKADGDFLHLEPKAMESCRTLSLDYAVMEKTDRAAVIRLDAQWSDIGAWGALWEMAEKDAAGNAVHGDATLEDCSGLYVRSDGIKVGIIGLKDLVVVAANDALLIAHRSRDADVGKLAERIPLAPTRVERPWGSYQVLESRPGYQVKYLEVQPGHAISLQYHRQRAEHWVVVKGTPQITVGETTRGYRVNESVFVPVGEKHRIANAGDAPCAIIEVQVGSYLGEDDIVRLEDRYNRK